MPRTPKPASKGGAGAVDTEDCASTSDSDFHTSSTPHSYTIPQWLIPEKQTAKFFSLPLPPIPINIKEAIRSHLKKQECQPSFKESTRIIHQITQLKHDEKVANLKVKVAKERLAMALTAKSDGIAELRETAEEETKMALENLEKIMRKDQEKELQQVKEKVQEQLKAEYKQKFAEEIELKRKREQNENEQQKQADEDNRAKRQKLDRSDPKTKGEETADLPKEPNKVLELEKKRKELQDKMEKLSERKSEMFWLLKQVIMQETKQKMARANVINLVDT